MGVMTDILTEARSIQGLAMIDEVRIDHPGPPVTDRATGEVTEAWDLVYHGAARCPRADSTTRVVVTGETITPAQPTVIVPWDTTGVRPDDRVTVTRSVSPGMVGRVLWVTDLSPRTYQSAVHLTCREVR